MSKKTSIFTFFLVLFFSLAVSAAMGGNNTSGHMMGDHNGTMTTHTKHMAMHNSSNTKMIDNETAKTMMKMYMKNRSQGGYRLKNFTDDGEYFKADVMSPGGTLVNKLVVNKKNENIYFTKK